MPAPPHDASGHTWHHPDQLLFDITKHGVAKAAKLPGYDTAMPAFDGVLSDAEIVAVLSWIKSQWPAEIRKHQADIDTAARTTSPR
jgi:mono/diheme cytochrome c family protein